MKNDLCQLNSGKRHLFIIVLQQKIILHVTDLKNVAKEFHSFAFVTLKNANLLELQQKCCIK